MDPNLITAASNIIAEPIKIIIDTWLKPKLEEFLKRKKIDKALFEDLSNLFSEYLNRTYNQQNSMNILALELQQVELEQVYIPLRIFSDEKDEKITINEFNLGFIKKYKKIVIEDTAGMGKSTLMKKLFISSIKQNINIPIFIELRNLTSDKDIIDEIIESLDSINRQFDKDIIRELIARGDFTFFLDGFDEIAFLHKEKVITELLKFIAKADNNYFFLTSRYDESLSSFGQFQKFKIEDLKPEEAYTLLDKYDSVTRLKIASEAIKQIQENIGGEVFKELNAFLGNPLLVSLLYLTFKYKRDIPSSKNDFYRKVYDALYDSHDLTKGGYKRFKYCNLSSEELKKVLKRLGFLCLKENENYFNKDKLLSLIREAKSSYFSNLLEENILKDILETVPLMICIGFEYKWAHKSFMEYFSALFIDDQVNKEKILQNIYNSKNFSVYLNMLDFYNEINRSIFDKVIVYPILNNFVKYIRSNLSSPAGDLLEYYQIIYNRAYYGSSDSTPGLIAPKRERILKDEIVISFPKIEDYSWDGASIGGKGNVCAFKKDKKVASLIKLLSIKNYPFIKVLIQQLKRDSNKQLDFFYSFEIPLDLCDNATERISVIQESFGIPLNWDKTDFYYSVVNLDYFGTLKYIKLIEEETAKREEDIFSDL